MRHTVIAMLAWLTTERTNIMNRWTLAATGAAALLALAGCSNTTTAQTSNPGTVTSTPNTMSSSSFNKTLQAFHWDLEKADDSAGRVLPAFTALAPKNVVRLSFIAGKNPGEQIVATKVCNNMSGSYQLNGNDFKVGNLASTNMACATPGLMQLEQAVGAQLQRATAVHFAQDANPPRMMMQFNDGSRWHLVGKPTDATRYGSAGETIFLEVGPETKPCTAGVARTQCLQVREVRYDEAGRKSIAGDWQHFYTNIQGFEFERGYRTVLRVKRYPVANPPADGSSLAYVLDMRVETERVGK